jgi:hypothetical protein
MVPCSRSRTRAAPADRQHGDVIEDRHDAGEPCRRHIRIEDDSHREVDRRQRHALRAGNEVRYLAGDDLLRIAGAETRLHHRGRIDVDLNGGPAPAQNVALEVRGMSKVYRPLLHEIGGAIVLLPRQQHEAGLLGHACIERNMAALRMTRAKWVRFKVMRLCCRFENRGRLGIWRRRN